MANNVENKTMKQNGVQKQTNTYILSQGNTSGWWGKDDVFDKLCCVIGQSSKQNQSRAVLHPQEKSNSECSR